MRLKGISERSAPKPVAISLLMARAMARASRPAGHTCASGKISCRNSAIATLSCTVKEEAGEVDDDEDDSDDKAFGGATDSTGTRPEGERWRSASFGPRPSTSTSTSAKGTPALRSSSQGRSDHDE